MYIIYIYIYENMCISLNMYIEIPPVPDSEARFILRWTPGGVVRPGPEALLHNIESGQST